MAPTASKKGTRNTARDRRSSSRQSTPLSALGDTAPPTPQAATPQSAIATPSIPKETGYIHTPTAALVSHDDTISALIEKANGSIANKSADPPSARELHALHGKIKETINKFMTRRGEVCDRSMRQLAQKRKERIAMEREQEASRAAAEDAARVKREKEEESEKERERKEKKKSKSAGSGKKRSADEMELDVEEGERQEQKDALPNVGAHGIARQDGVGVNEGECNPCVLVKFAMAVLRPCNHMQVSANTSESQAQNLHHPRSSLHDPLSI